MLKYAVKSKKKWRRERDESYAHPPMPPRTHMQLACLGCIDFTFCRGHISTLESAKVPDQGEVTLSVRAHTKGCNIWSYEI